MVINLACFDWFRKSCRRMRASWFILRSCRSSFHVRLEPIGFCSSEPSWMKQKVDDFNWIFCLRAPRLDAYWKVYCQPIKHDRDKKEWRKNNNNNNLADDVCGLSRKFLSDDWVSDWLMTQVLVCHAIWISSMHTTFPCEKQREREKESLFERFSSCDELVVQVQAHG